MTTKSEKKLFELLFTKIPEIKYLPQDKFGEFALGESAIIATEDFSKNILFNIDPAVYRMDSQSYYCEKFGYPSNYYEQVLMIVSSFIIDSLQPIIKPIFKLPGKGDVLASIYDKEKDLFYGFRFNMMEQSAKFDFKAEADLRYLFRNSYCRKFIPAKESEFINYLSHLSF